MSAQKDLSIQQLIELIELQEHGWHIVDFWEADLCAIGIASAAIPDRLVYVSTFGKPPKYYDFECELIGADFQPVKVLDAGTDVPFDQLRKSLIRWLDKKGAN